MKKESSFEILLFSRLIQDRAVYVQHYQIELCERIQERVVYLVLGLPNSTSCNQYLDHICQEFKGGTHTKINEVFALMITVRNSRIVYLKD